MLRRFLSVFIVLSLITPITTFGYIPNRQTDLDLSGVKVIAPASQEFSRESVSMVIPANMSASTDGEVVGRQVLDHSLQSVLSGKYFKDSQFIETARRVESVFKPNLTFGSKENGQTQHNIKMELLALQNQARLSYSGLINANLAYFAGDKSLDFSINEDIGKQTQLILSHQAAATDTVSSVRIQLNW